MDPVRSQFAASAADRVGRRRASRATARKRRSATRPSRSRPSRLPAIAPSCRPRFASNSSPINERVPDGYQLEYRPGLLGKGKVHFVRKADGIDVWRDCFVLQSIHDTPPDDVWDGAFVYRKTCVTENEPDAAGRFADLPSELARDKSYPIFARQLSEHLYRDESLKLWKCAALDQCSQPDEEEADFPRPPGAAAGRAIEGRARKTRKGVRRQAGRCRRPDFAAHKPGSARSAGNSSPAWAASLWVVVDTVLSAMGKGLPGRRRSLDPAFRSVATETRPAIERPNQRRQCAEGKGAARTRIPGQTEEPGSKLQLQTTCRLESIELKPQKGDIEVDKVSLVWLPWRIDAVRPRRACLLTVYDHRDRRTLTLPTTSDPQPLPPPCPNANVGSSIRCCFLRWVPPCATSCST